MTLVELLDKANAGYPDGFLREYYNSKTGRPRKGKGDTLAQFIVIELSETFDPDADDDDQRYTADRMLRAAVTELESVRRALHQ
jgi:hypothetical protein